MPIASLLTPSMVARYTAAGYWGSMTLADYLEFHAAYTPDRLAVVDAKSRVTFAELKRATERVALAMIAMGIRPGDRVGLQTPNWVEYFYVRLACARIGAIVVPQIFSVREHEIEMALTDTRAVAFFFCARFHEVDYVAMVERLRPRLPALRHWVAMAGPAPGYPHLDSLLADPIETRTPVESLQAFHPSANDVDILMSTSGSTGKPKLVLRTPNIFLTLGHHIVERARLGRDDVVLAVAPINQGTGYSVAMVAALIAGCRNVLLDRFEADAAVDLIAQEKVTVAVGVPTHMIKMMNSPRVGAVDTGSLRLFYHAGAPLAPDAAAEFSRLFDCRLMEAYGALDGGTPVHTHLDDPGERTFHTVGTACAGMELRIVGEDGRVLPPGQEGEVVYRGPNCAVGLWEDPNHSFDAEGWFTSGDLGVLDAAGYLRIVGRKKNIIIRGGQNISPREVEDALIAHPKIQDVAIVKMPDPVMGEKACAFVVPRAGQTVAVQDCLDFLIERHFAKYKAPERVEMLAEFPLLPNGKVDRKALEAQILRLVNEGR
ncbi:MAG: AMP-binding protein [Rhodospirillales bacterium]|nr:AMP-binding protein [Rhodospirillales bacterium]